MSYYRIHGPAQLSGTFQPAGNKNAALPIIAATLLTTEPVRLENVPDIQDVRALLVLLEDLGAEVEWTGPNELEICTGSIEEPHVDPGLARQIRASVLLAGPMCQSLGNLE